MPKLIKVKVLLPDTRCSHVKRGRREGRGPGSESYPASFVCSCGGIVTSRFVQALPSTLLDQYERVSASR
jgi:hypothetical protein